MNKDIAATLKRARVSQGLSIRDLAARAGVSTATVQRVESGPDELQAKTLRKITDVLGLPAPRLDEYGVWRIDTHTTAEPAGNPTTSGTVTDLSQGVIVSFRVPEEFLKELSPDELEGVKADTLVALLQLARDAQRRSTNEARGT